MEDHDGDRQKNGETDLQMTDFRGELFREWRRRLNVRGGLGKGGWHHQSPGGKQGRESSAFLIGADDTKRSSALRSSVADCEGDGSHGPVPNDRHPAAFVGHIEKLPLQLLDLERKALHLHGGPRYIFVGGVLECAIESF